MPDIRYVKDKNGNIFYPVTHEQAVRDSNGVTVGTKLSQTSTMLDNMGSLMIAMSNTIDGLSASAFVTAWDGASVPNEWSIPYGVVVQYNGDSYTGTLNPSADTIGKIYLVGQEGSDTKAQYVTSRNGNSYSWSSFGTTDIVLSEYKRKDDEVWLTEDEFASIAVKDPTKTYNVYEEIVEI